MIVLKRILPLGCAILMVANLYAQDDKFTNIYKNYKIGSYSEALNELSSFESKEQKILAIKYYLSGLCYNKMGEYDKAVLSYERAIKENSQAIDIYYELGQAAYAANDLTKAKKAFSTSVEKNYKPGSSLYYMGYIDQTMEEYKDARTSYERLLKEPAIETSILQAAGFQLGEIYLALAQKKDNTRELVKKHVLPQFKKTLELDKNSQIAIDINRRIIDLEKMYNLDPNIMVNGRDLGKKRADFSIGQKIKYDNNVTQVTEQPTAAQSKFDSYIFETNLFARYNASLMQRFVFSPELRLDYSRYSDQTHPEVYKNDNYSISPALRNSIEHTAFKNQAALIYDFEFNYTARDTDSTKTKRYYGKSGALVLGEKFKLFSFGDTTIKGKAKVYKSYQYTSESKTYSAMLDQIVILQNKKLLIFLISVDNAIVNNSSNSTLSYLFRTDYLLGNLIENYSFNLAYAYTAVNTKEQKEARGIETTHNPSFKVTRKNIFLNGLNVSVGYDYTRNISKDKANYDYKKHVVNSELKYNF